MSTAQIDREEEKAAGQAVRLLYICDFPPSNLHGGAILLKRLLEGYPVECLTVITSGQGMTASKPSDRLGCRHIAFPVLGVSRRLWVGRVKHVANWLIVGFVALRAAFEIKRRRIRALITILQGRFYFAAAFAGWITGVPYIVVAHDDFISANKNASRFSRKILNPVTGRVLRRASHVYSVSLEMQRLLSTEFDVQSEIQMPATAEHKLQVTRNKQSGDDRDLIVVCAGAVSYALEDSLGLRVSLRHEGKIRVYGIPGVRLHLYTDLSDQKSLALGSNHPSILVKGWIPQSEVPRALASADILFLFSFLESSRHTVETAFPFEDCRLFSLRRARPILVFGPKYYSWCPIRL